MVQPRVCIGLTVDNGCEHIESVLDSLLGQTFGDFELVISDDGSTDLSESICRDRAARDRRIRYYREEEHRGPFWNTNRVFELSGGEYFKWATHDDLCGPEFLARCVELLDADPTVAWCHTLTSHVDQHGHLLPASADPDIPEGQSAHSLIATGPGLPTSTRRSGRPHERFQAVVLGTHWCPDGYGLIRSEVLRRTRPLQPCYGAGKVLLAEISLQGRFEEVPETLFFERIRPADAEGSMTAPQRQAFVAPTGASRILASRLKLLHEYVLAVRHADLTTAERGRCLAVLARYLFQTDKWKRILRKGTCRTEENRELSSAAS